MRKPLLAVAIPFALLMTGCAFVDQRLALKYQPQGPAVATATRSTEVVLSVRMDTDLQRRKEDVGYIIGTVKNGYGVKTADAFTTDRVDDWIAGAFTSELTRAGFTVRRLDPLPPQVGRGLQIIIRRIWVEADPGFWTVGAITDLTFVMEIYSQGQLAKAVLIEAKGDSRSMIGGSERKEDSLQKALQAATVQGLPHIIAAMPAD